MSSAPLLFGVDRESAARVDATLATRRDKATVCSAAQSETGSAVLFVLGQFRLYLLSSSGGELLRELHLFDVKSVAQADAAKDPLVIEAKAGDSSSSSSVAAVVDAISLRGLSVAASDAFLRLFALSYRENLPQLPKFAACKFRVDKRRFPADLDRHVVLGPCGGFVRSYECCCAFYGVAPRQDVAWTVNELWAFNGVREFNMLEFDTLERAHVKALIFSLRYNDWFDSFVLSDASMPSGAWSALASCLAINLRLARLEFSRVVDLPSQALAKLFAAMHENRACAVTELDVSRNALEPRDVSALALLLSSSRLELQALSLNRCTLPPKSISTLLTALCDEQQHGVARHLRTLDLSHAVLTAAGASAALGRALAAAAQLHTLILCCADLRCGELLAALWAAAAPSAPPLAALTQLNVRGCRDPTLLRLVRACASVRVLDVSDTLLSAGELCSLLAQPASTLTTLACSGMADHWSEQDVLNVLAAIGGITASLRRLEFDGNFHTAPKSAALRAQAIEALSRCLGTVAPDAADADADPGSGLVALSVRGDGAERCAGASLLPLLLSLAGASIRELDVRGNALGDVGAAALARALQANASLRRLEIDQNGIGLSGFRRLLDAMERNLSLTDLSMPVLDGAAMLKARTDDATDYGTSLASTAASRFEQRSATNVLAELHALLMRNVQLAVLDATRKGKSAADLVRPRSRSQIAAARPPAPAESDDGVLHLNLADVPQPARERGQTIRPAPLGAKSAVAAADSSDDLEQQIRQLEGAHSSEAEALAREQAELEAERLALEQEALEQEQRALERELAGNDTALAAERAALEAERAAIARELASLSADEAATAAADAASAANNDDDENWDSMSPEEQAIRMEIEKLELEIEQNETKLVELFDREQQALNAADDDDDDDQHRGAVDEIARDRRRIHNAIEENELRVESLKSKLAVGNFAGARRQEKPVKASSTAKAAAGPQPATSDKGAFRAMLNAKFAQQSQSAQLAQMRQRRASVMRPTFEASGELARLLTGGQPEPTPPAARGITAPTPRGAPVRLPARPPAAAPVAVPSRFRRGPASAPPPPAGAARRAPLSPPSRLSAAAEPVDLFELGAERQPDFAKSARESFRETVRESNKPRVPAPVTPRTAAAVATAEVASPAPTVTTPRVPAEPAAPVGPIDTLPREKPTAAPAVTSPRAPAEPAAPVVPITTLPREHRNSRAPQEPVAPVETLQPRAPQEPAPPIVPIDTLPREHRGSIPSAAPTAAVRPPDEPSPPVERPTVAAAVSMPVINLPARLKPSEARRVMRQTPPGGPSTPAVPWGDATFRRNALTKAVPTPPRPGPAPAPTAAAADLRTASLPRKMTLGRGPDTAVAPAPAAAQPLAQSIEVPPPPPEPTDAVPPPPAKVESPPPSPPPPGGLKASLSSVSLASARQGCAAREAEARQLVSGVSQRVDECEDVAQLVQIGQLLKSCKPIVTDAVDVVPDFQLSLPNAADPSASKIEKLKHVLRVTLGDLAQLVDAAQRLIASAAATDQQLEATQELLGLVVTSLRT